MNFKSTKWYPVAVGLSALNLAGVAFAVWPGEPWHATTHAALALGFGVWAQRLRQGARAEALPAGETWERTGALPGQPQAALEDLEAEVGLLRQELSEAQERLDFAERMLAREPERRPGDG